MKNFNKILLLGLAFVLAWGCKKVEDIIVLNPNAKLVAIVVFPTPPLRFAMAIFIQLFLPVLILREGKIRNGLNKALIPFFYPKNTCLVSF